MSSEASDAATGGGEGTRLRSGTVGMWDLVFFVVAAAAPLSVMSGVSPLAIQFGGLGAPGGYLVAGIVMAVFAIGFTAMSRYVRNAGAFYAYISKGFGRTVGVGAAFVAVLSYVAITIGFVPALGVFAHDTFASVFGIDLPWTVWALLGLVIVAWLGYHQIALSAKILGVLLILEVVVLLVLAVPVLLSGGEHGLSVDGFAPSHVFGPHVGALFVLSFGAFLGFESTAIYSEEAKDPRRTVRRATFVAVGFLAIFYTLIVWVGIMAYGPDQALRAAADDPTGMFFVAMERWVGSGATDAMHVLIVTSTLAATLAFHNASSRYLHALGREGVLPRGLATAGAKTGAPVVASLTVTVLTIVVVGVSAAFGAKPYEQIFLWTNGPGILGLIMLMALCSAAVVAYFRRSPHDASLVQRVFAPALACATLSATSVLIVKNFDLLTAADSTTNVLLIGTLPVAFVIGIGVALRIRSRDREAFQRLTTTSIAEVEA
ncbi:APC family permease [Conexibacter woesei]|uniref:Amino acid permease-associated region n=1 Tax=Conexibacter woesei (strain DSM 14684 / CCUG 47730 / CIP 108061 / JCM 11494 / NBRC 100937 / ID131577) TaxID=469383 RepID=D3FA53_CONWI|nr:APC family permease [Conexibacter woesei]ADB53148.1 amino acid permease-associated region [Conexibacter woesei DSM 14684]